MRLSTTNVYSASNIVVRLHGQLNIDAGLVNQKSRPDVKMASMSSVLTIFASTISVLAGYR